MGKLKKTLKWLLAGLCLVGIVTFAIAQNEKDALDPEMSSLEAWADHVLLDEAHRPGKLLFTLEGKQDGKVALEDAGYTALIDRVKAMKKNIELASYDRNEEDLEHFVGLRTLADIIGRYYTIEKRLYLNYLKNAHAIPGSEIKFSSNDFDYLNLHLFPKSAYRIQLDDDTYHLKFNLKHVTNLFYDKQGYHTDDDQVELGMTPGDKDRLEQAALSDNKTDPAYAKLIQFLELRRSILNQWAIERMNPNSHLKEPENKSCGYNLVSFHDHYFDALSAEDKYEENDREFQLLRPLTENRPLLSAADLGVFARQFFTSWKSYPNTIGRNFYIDNGDDKPAGYDTATENQYFTQDIPKSAISQIEALWLKEDSEKTTDEMRTLLDSNFLADDWKPESVAARTAQGVYFYQRHWFTKYFIEEATRRGILEFKDKDPKVVKAAELTTEKMFNAFLAERGATWRESLRLDLLSKLQSPAAQAVRDKLTAERFEQMFEKVSVGITEGAHALYVKKLTNETVEQNKGNHLIASKLFWHDLKDFEMGFINSYSWMKDRVAFWKPEQLHEFYNKKLEFWTNSKVQKDGGAAIGASAEAILNSPPVMRAMEGFFKEVSEKYYTHFNELNSKRLAELKKKYPNPPNSLEEQKIREKEQRPVIGSIDNTPIYDYIYPAMQNAFRAMMKAPVRPSGEEEAESAPAKVSTHAVKVPAACVKVLAKKDALKPTSPCAKFQVDPNLLKPMQDNIRPLPQHIAHFNAADYHEPALKRPLPPYSLDYQLPPVIQDRLQNVVKLPRPGQSAITKEEKIQNLKLLAQAFSMMNLMHSEPTEFMPRSKENTVSAAAMKAAFSLNLNLVPESQSVVQVTDKEILEAEAQIVSPHGPDRILYENGKPRVVPQSKIMYSGRAQSASDLEILLNEQGGPKNPFESGFDYDSFISAMGTPKASRDSEQVRVVARLRDQVREYLMYTIPTSILDQKILAGVIADQTISENPLLGIQTKNEEDAPNLLDALVEDYSETYHAMAWPQAKQKVRDFLWIAEKNQKATFHDACFAKPLEPTDNNFAALFKTAEGFRKNLIKTDRRFQKLDDEVRDQTKTGLNKFADDHVLGTLFLALFIGTIIYWSGVGVIAFALWDSVGISVFTAQGAQIVFETVNANAFFGLLNAMLNSKVAALIGNIFIVQALAMGYVDCYQLPAQLNYQIRATNSQIGIYNKEMISRKSLAKFADEIHGRIHGAELAIGMAFLGPVIKGVVALRNLSAPGSRALNMLGKTSPETEALADQMSKSTLGDSISDDGVFKGSWDWLNDKIKTVKDTGINSTINPEVDVPHANQLMAETMLAYEKRFAYDTERPLEFFKKKASSLDQKVQALISEAEEIRAFTKTEGAGWSFEDRLYHWWQNLEAKMLFNERFWDVFVRKGLIGEGEIPVQAGFASGSEIRAFVMYAYARSLMLEKGYFLHFADMLGRIETQYLTKEKGETFIMLNSSLSPIERVKLNKKIMREFYSHFTQSDWMMYGKLMKWISKTEKKALGGASEAAQSENAQFVSEIKKSFNRYKKMTQEIEKVKLKTQGKQPAVVVIDLSKDGVASAFKKSDFTDFNEDGYYDFTVDTEPISCGATGGSNCGANTSDTETGGFTSSAGNSH